MQVGTSMSKMSTASAQEAVNAQRLKAALDTAGENREAAAKKLEALFATMLVREMRKSLPKGFFGDGPGADTFNGWFDQKLGQSLSDSGALDLAGQISVSLQAKEAAQAQ